MIAVVQIRCIALCINAFWRPPLSAGELSQETYNAIFGLGLAAAQPEDSDNEDE